MNHLLLKPSQMVFSIVFRIFLICLSVGKIFLLSVLEDVKIMGLANLASKYLNKRASIFPLCGLFRIPLIIFLILTYLWALNPAPAIQEKNYLKLILVFSLSPIWSYLYLNSSSFKNLVNVLRTFEAEFLPDFC